MFGGGQSGEVNTNFKWAIGGCSGNMISRLVYLEVDEEILITIGSGGIAPNINNSRQSGGTTYFGNLSTTDSGAFGFNTGFTIAASGSNPFTLYGNGAGLCSAVSHHLNDSVAQDTKNSWNNAHLYFGGGGAATFYPNSGSYGIGAGAPGSIRVRWFDPSKNLNNY